MDSYREFIVILQPIFGGDELGSSLQAALRQDIRMAGSATQLNADLEQNIGYLYWYFFPHLGIHIIFIAAIF